MFLIRLISCRKFSLIIIMIVVVVFVICCVMLYGCDLDIMLNIPARLVEFF